MLLRRTVRLPLLRVLGCIPRRRVHIGHDELERLSKEEPKTQLRNSEIEFMQSSKDLVPQCASCGIQLQRRDALEIGFYQEPKNTGKAYHSKRLQYMSAFAQLDDEGKKLLSTGSETSEDAEAIPVPQKEEELICLRCHNALHHNVFKVNEHQPMNMQEVISPIPLNHQLVHVFSAYDFPLSLVSFKSRKNVMYVMNKVDLLCGHKSFSEKYGSFFSKMLYRLTGDKQINVISAHTSWSIPELLKKMGNVNYLVGFVNTGKTRLANRLLNMASQVSSPGQRNIAPTGSSHLPALTRDNIVHRCGEKKIIDTPGFMDQSSVFHLIKVNLLKTTLQGKKVMVNDLRMARYESVKGGQCFTVSGLFFLLPPENTVLQVVPVCKGEPRVFSSLEKATSVVKSPPDALKACFLVKGEAMDDLIRYVIPPFQGTVDLLIKDIGYVQITPVGRKNNDDLFEVWAPRGVVLGVRETIEHFMTRYIKKHKTKVVKKSKNQLEEKQVLRMKSKAFPDYKIFSRLYEIPVNAVNPKDEMEVQYRQYIDEYGLSYNKWSAKETRDETRNKYWIERL